MNGPLAGCGGSEPPCHSLGVGGLTIRSGDLDATYASLVGAAAKTPGAGVRVLPGDPDHSFLMRKLRGTQSPDEGAPMPKPHGIRNEWQQLPADELELVRCWIAGGAQH
jgi:hypothetical protein